MNATRVAAAPALSADGPERDGTRAGEPITGGGTVVGVVGRRAASGPSGLLLVSAPRPGAIGTFYELAASDVTIGRSGEATIRVDDPGISRLHLRIARRPDGHYVAQDLGSTNGTYVKGVGVRSVTLVEGDRIQLGTSTEFLFGTRREAADEEIRLRQAVAAAGAGTWEWKVEGGALAFAGGLARALGREPETTDPRTADDWVHVHADDRAPLRARLEAAAERGGTVEAECRLVRPDGGVTWAAMTGEAFRDERGAPVRVAGAAMDVTERKRAELELRRHALLFDSISDAVVTVGLDGSILDWNASAERMFGWTRAQALGRRPGALLDPAGDDALTAAVVGCAREGARLTEERALRGRGGAEVVAEVVAVPLRGGDETLGCVVVFRDVGERRRLQSRLQLAERLASLGTLAAGVAHEINNPLSYLASNLEYVAMRLASAADVLGARYADVDAALADSRTGAARIRDIVLNLKTFTGHGATAKGPVDPNAALEFALRVADNLVRHRARVVKDLAPVPPVAGGEGALGQVFLNLLVNAAHAIAPGRASSSTIRVATRHDAATGRVVVEIADTGCGIAPEHLRRIFEPFFTTKAVGMGTGLGLFVCHGIVSSLGGEIEVESAPGRGSTFRVLLPAAEPEAAAPPRPAVLVVDDEPLLGPSIARFFAERYDVVSLTDPGEALRRVRAGQRFVLVLVDLCMPDMPGRELVARLRDLAPDQAERAVYVTGGPLDDETRRFLDEEKPLVLEKPLDMARVAALLERAAQGAAASG